MVEAKLEKATSTYTTNLKKVNEGTVSTCVLFCAMIWSLLGYYVAFIIISLVILFHLFL